MFVGHVAAGMALKTVGKEINLGLLVFAALFPDLLLWIFVLLGFEQVIAPPDFARHPYLTFVFPYSHSLVATAAWSLAAAVIAWRWARRKETALVGAPLALGLAVASHFVLDAAVHVRDLPLDRESSVYFGTGLWEKSMGTALALELGLVAGAAAAYERVVGLRGSRLWTLLLTLLLCSVVTVAGATLQKTPPPPAAAAWSGLAAIAIVSGILGIVDRRPRSGASPA